MTPSTVPGWVDRKAYPFAPRRLATPQGEMSYVDEGTGEVILFVHGNPSWSFMYRELIKGLSPRYRCVAPDHLGFGLSDKPQGASYQPEVLAENLERLIATLGLRDITLVLHDWGGPIGLHYAVRHPENIKRLIVFNTTCWSLKGIRAAERFSGFMGSRLGHFLCCHLNIFPKYIIPSVFGDRRHLTRGIHRQYIAPFSTPRSREGAWVLVTALIPRSDWMEAIWAERGKLRDKPVLILSGDKDPTFGPEKLARWHEAFPDSECHSYPGVGHFVAEELGADAVAPVARFLGGGAPEVEAATHSMNLGR